MTNAGRRTAIKAFTRSSAVTVLWLVFYLLLTLASFPSPLLAEDYSFDLSEVEKKPYHLGGYAELRPLLYGLDKDAALYQLRFYNREEGHTLPEYNGALQLEGSLEKGMARFFFRTNTAYQDSYLGTTSKTRYSA